MAEPWKATKCMYAIPTDLFTILQPHNQELSVFYVVQKRRAMDFEAPKL